MLCVVIVNWNTRDHLRVCLRSLAAFGVSGMRVVVVDNASSDGSAEMVTSEFDWVRLVSAGANLGYAAANNLGFREAGDAEFVLTLNPDTEFFDDSLQRALDAMRGLPEVGAMGIRLVDPDGETTQPSLRSFPRPSAIVPEALGLGRLFGAYRMRGFDYSRSQEAEQPMGTFLLFRGSALREVGEMDERFPIFFNEVDLLQRLVLAGWKVWYFADGRVKHLGGASTRQVKKSMIWESHRSLIRYYRKWYLRWWNAPLLWLFFGWVWLAALVRARGVHPGFVRP